MTLLDDECPVRSGALQLETWAENNVLVNDAGRQVLILNETALALWDLCDGRTRVDEMVEAVVQLFGAERDSIRRDVTAAMARLHEAGAVSYYRP